MQWLVWLISICHYKCGLSETECFSKVVKDFIGVGGAVWQWRVPDCDSNNDFLLSFPWVVNSRAQAAGNDTLERPRWTSPCIAFAWIQLKWRSAEGWAQAGRWQLQRGWLEMNSSCFVATEPHLGWYEGNMFIGKNWYNSLVPSPTCFKVTQTFCYRSFLLQDQI